MKRFFKVIVFAAFMVFTIPAKSQVLISLIFGEALNTPKIEFGLVGGLNRSYLLDVPKSTPLNNFNIGFYFHIWLKENSFISTGCLVKSNVGATGMPVYSIGDPSFDSIYANGQLTKKIHYFYVPIMYQYRVRNQLYFEAGFQVGLRNRAEDIFNEKAYDGELEYTTDAREQYVRLDAGLIGGIGYKFRKELKSTAVGINYYYGLVNVSTNETVIKNSSIYFYAKIPIGAVSAKDD